MPTLLHHLIDDAAVRWPDRTAVSTTTESVTFRELADASLRGAAWLSARGVRRGDRVVVVGPSSVLVPALLYATSRIGAVFCVLHEQTSGRPLEHVLGETEPALVVGETDEVAALGVPSAAAREELFAAAEPVGVVADGPLPVDPLCLIYTSGTTSASPAAVVSTHAQAVFAVLAIHDALAYRPDDVVYCPLPLSFDYGMYQLFLGAVSGARVHLGMPAEVGPSLLRNLHESGATVLASVPAVSDTLLRLLRRKDARPPSLRLLTNTGAAMPPDLVDNLRAAIPTLAVQLMFGLTECKRATIMPPDGDRGRPGSCGLPLAGTEVFAADATGKRLPAREIGELVVRGPNVMAGYWRRPDLTERRFPRAEGLFPCLRTGDHGWVDEDGYVYFVGRVDDIYKERGFRVSATEVEAAARRVPGVERAAVIPPLDGLPALLVVVGESTPDEVLRRMRAEIEEFKIPRRCVIVESLPLTRNGKVDRKALRAVVSGA
ncbi:AMP-dependent synthetase [Saccharothrix sp. ALI-22-I]|uniref:class I adenylate-forming enzyme family protein n=1 Tax=Saccharothrix sp. ALI-22-I TaxID=1933778 RepID=UPI00097CA88C|nr:class I adenylate-forming enzyme family protein [Saccharothrix sp. ALI-22-I]ONI91079.1 AMP-dependent synthetase [Saccharothrix sp. ALI-22-I]